MPGDIGKCRPATKVLYTFLSIFQDSMGLYFSLVRHCEILKNVFYFKSNDKILRFEKDHQHVVGFVLTMLLRIAVSLPIQVKKQTPQSLKCLQLKFCTIAKHFQETTNLDRPDGRHAVFH